MKGVIARALSNPRTTLAGWLTGLLHFATQPDVKHALLGLGIAIIGTLSGDAQKALGKS